MANEGPDCLRVDIMWDADVRNALTMNVAALAICGPHVSAMISRVNAWVPISMPLLTNIKRGSFDSSRLGRNLVRVSLESPFQLTSFKIQARHCAPDGLGGDGKQQHLHALNELLIGQIRSNSPDVTRKEMIL